MDRIVIFWGEFWVNTTVVIDDIDSGKKLSYGEFDKVTHCMV